MNIVTKINDAKRIRCKTRSFQKTLKWLKRNAHKIDRRNSRQALRCGYEYHSKPLLTGRDIC